MVLPWTPQAGSDEAAKKRFGSVGSSEIWGMAPFSAKSSRLSQRKTFARLYEWKKMGRPSLGTNEKGSQGDPFQISFPPEEKTKRKQKKQSTKQKKNRKQSTPVPQTTNSIPQNKGGNRISTTTATTPLPPQKREEEKKKTHEN